MSPSAQGTDGHAVPSTGLLLRMLDHLPGMVAWWGADLRNRFANATYAEWFGGTPEQLQGRHIRDVLGAEVFGTVEQYATCALTGERSTFERVLFDPAGEPRSTTTHYVPATVDGAASGFYVLIADISARSRVERALEESVRQMALLQERQRIAADLHDLVIQRLFAAGMQLQAVRRGKGNAEGRLNEAAVGVDDGIRELRRAIHSLREVSTPKQVPALIERVLGNVSRVLGFVPTMTYSGTLDAVPDVVLQDLLAVVNEALSNVARHAGATEVRVELAGSADEVALRVTDDGRGVGPTTRSSGLSNMRDRAERHGGGFSLTDNQPRGTVLEWRVPLGSPGDVRPPRRAPVDGDLHQEEADEEPTPSAGGRARDIDAAALLHMLDELPAIVSAYDDRGRNLYANRAHETYYGVSPAAVRGRHVSEVLGSALYEASRRQLNEVLTGRSQHFERTLCDSEGRERHMQVHYVPDVVDGEARGFYCLATDVSARVRAEEALDESTRHMTLLEERQRIAADLHDMVIQRLFAAGLDLTVAQRGRPDAEERIARAAEAVDESIRELREAIHSLGELMVPRQLPATMEEVIARASQQLGFVPTVTYTGSLDAVPEEVVSDLVTVVDEALGHLAQHAGATAVVVVLACSADHVLAQILDDGDGDGDGGGPGQVSGDAVTGMRARAERHGGSLSVRPHHPRGTVVEWLVPLG